MSDRPHYISGRPWGACDRCDEIRRRDTLRKEWTGLIVCAECWDPRPAEMTPPLVYPEGIPIREPRPEPPPIYVGPNDVTEDDL